MGAKKTNLFTRIVIRLTLPLLFLSASFAGIQLTNQMNAMNEFYKIQSRFAFEAIEKALALEIKNEENWTHLQTFKEKLKTIANFHQAASIDLFDPINRKSLFLESEFPWTFFDFQAMEESLEQKHLGKPFHVRLDKQFKRLNAYIPLEGRGKEVTIARVIFPLASVKDALIQSRWTLGIMVFFVLITGILIAQGLAHSIVKPIQTLNEASQEIVQGRLGKEVSIKTGDEIESLGTTFNHMSRSLIKMKQRAEDSNPLTQLPGNQGIFHEASKRILERQKFVLFHTDLDRFKVFNDRYGLARGDEVIKKTAKLLKEAAAAKGTPDDFIGHQGGDDFIVLTRPSHAKAVAEYVVEHFDKELIKSVYRKEDYERGYTLDVDRRRLAETGEERIVEFPLIAISLAGVSSAKRDFADYYECMNFAVGAKKEVKKVIQSSYVIKE